MEIAQTRICPKNETQNCLGNWYTIRLFNPDQKTRFNFDYETRKLQMVDLAQSTDYRLNLKESKYLNRYLDFVRVLKNQGTER